MRQRERELETYLHSPILYVKKRRMNSGWLKFLIFPIPPTVCEALSYLPATLLDLLFNPAYGVSRPQTMDSDLACLELTTQPNTCSPAPVISRGSVHMG